MNWRILTTSADLAANGVVTADLGVVRKEFADQYPDVVKQYVAVLDQAVQAYRSDPKASVAALAKELNITPAETEAAAKELIWLDASEQKDPKYLGTGEKPGEFAKVLKSSADFVAAQKTIPAAPELATYQQGIYTKGL